MIAWHFVGDTLRDGRPIPPDGEWLTHVGEVCMCAYGLHASLEPFDSLRYAPGDTLCLVEIEGVEQQHADKVVCRRRKIVSRMDATKLLLYFARMQALSVIHLWDTPQVVLDYLMTGDPSIRSQAMRVAWAELDATGQAARAAWAAWAAMRVAWAAWAAWAAGEAAWVAGDATGEATGQAARAAARGDFNALVYECFEEYLND